VIETIGLGPDLERAAETLEAAALQAGLRPGPVRFQALPSRELHALAARGGYPRRHRSWRFGAEFNRLERARRLGASRLLELVTFGEPTIASLDAGNHPAEQRLVMAHVLGHADLFVHSRWFAGLGTQVAQLLASNAVRVEAWVEEVGARAVESLLDRLHPLSELLDPDLVLAGRFRTATSPADVLGLLLQRAELEPWERDLVRIVREEAYALLPPRLTRVINEGWASLWHSTLLPGGPLASHEVGEAARTHARATAVGAGGLNPYRLGLELLRHARGRGLDPFALRAELNDVALVEATFDAAFAASPAWAELTAARGRERRPWQEERAALVGELANAGRPRLRGECEGDVLTLVHDHDGRDLELDEAGAVLQGLASLWRGEVQLLTLESGRGCRLRAGSGAALEREEWPEALERCRVLATAAAA